MRMKTTRGLSVLALILFCLGGTHEAPAEDTLEL